MLESLARAEITPGPLILVTQFVGFPAAFREGHGVNPYVAGCLGALLTTCVTFAPCLLWISAGTPRAEALRANPGRQQALAAVTAAAIGVILNLAVWFATHVWSGRVTEQYLEILCLHTPDFASLDVEAVLLAAVPALYARLGLIATLVLAAVLGLILRLS